MNFALAALPGISERQLSGSSLTFMAEAVYGRRMGALSRGCCVQRQCHKAATVNATNGDRAPNCPIEEG